ncbi:hypothetical protein [Spirosoma aerophilum]
MGHVERIDWPIFLTFAEWELYQIRTYGPGRVRLQPVLALT